MPEPLGASCGSYNLPKKITNVALPPAITTKPRGRAAGTHLSSRLERRRLVRHPLSPRLVWGTRSGVRRCTATELCPPVSQAPKHASQRLREPAFSSDCGLRSRRVSCAVSKAGKREGKRSVDKRTDGAREVRSRALALPGGRRKQAASGKRSLHTRWLPLPSTSRLGLLLLRLDEGLLTASGHRPFRRACVRAGR